MIRNFALALAIAAGCGTVGMPVARAQTAPTQTTGQATGGQPAGQQAQERSAGAVGGWLWPILGLAAIGGVVAAASGGGGGGGGSSAPAGTQ